MRKLPSNFEAVPFVRAAAAANLVSFLQRHGVDPAPIFERLDIPISAVRDPYASIPLSAFTELMELVAEKTGVSSAGLQLGYELDPANWGALGFIVLNAPTLWSCLSNIERFLSPWQSGTYVKAVRARDHVRSEYAIIHPAVRFRDQDAELSLSFTANHLRRMTKGKAIPVHATFMHSQITKISNYEKYLGVRPVFGSETNAIYFDADAADLENESADRRLFLVISRHLEDLTQELPDTQNLADSVEELIRTQLAGKPPTLASVGRALAMQQRTLQRRLDDQGVSFSDLLAKVRLEDSRRYLESTEVEVKEIAYYLGFSDPSAFIKAFKRWTGQTPLRYRLTTNARGQSD